MQIKYNDGQPCNHKGCLSHISHPCEGCGRIGGKGIVYLVDVGDITLFDSKGEPLWKVKKENYFDLNQL